MESSTRLAESPQFGNIQSSDVEYRTGQDYSAFMRRAAMTGISRPQFGMRTLLVSVFVVSLLFASVAAAGPLGAYAFVFIFGIVLAVVGYWTQHRILLNVGALMVATTVFSFPFVMQSTKWIGSGNFVVTVRVVDTVNGKPNRGASVAIFDRDLGAPNSPINTDSSGSAVVAARFTKVGSDSLFENVGSIYLSSHMIEVICNGYDQVQKPLEEYTGSSCDLYAGSIPAIMVEMKPNR